MIHWAWLQPYLLYFGTVWFLDGWRLLRVRRIGVTLAASTALGILAVMPLLISAEVPDWLGYLAGALGLGWFFTYLYSFIAMVNLGRRFRDLAPRVELADEWGGEIVLQVRQGYRTPRDDLEELLPLVEVIGYVPGHPQITPEWIRAQLVRAEEKSAVVAELLREAPTTMPIPRRKWWLPSDL